MHETWRDWLFNRWRRIRRPAIRYRARKFWHSVQNWSKGYQFRQVQRFRCCGHTTPTHSRDCTA